jgi:hypothetical protein
MFCAVPKMTERQVKEDSMAGSEHSNEDMASGRANRAEESTKIWAQEKNSHFDGEAILVVEAAPNIEDEDYRLVDDTHKTHGILSSGFGSGAGVVAFSRHLIEWPGVELTSDDFSHMVAAGVFGKGKTGVVAQGDLRDPRSLKEWEDVNSGGGVGIIGRGNRGAPGVVGFEGGETDETIPAGTGIYGTGNVGIIGRGDKGAPGVGGFEGRETDETIPPGTGIYGKGSNGVVGVGTDGPGVSGTGSAGTGSAGTGSPGVIGTGGKGPDPEAKQGTGVVGTGGTGVVGVGGDGPTGTGVYGESQTSVYPDPKRHADGTGVYGTSKAGRGAVFESKKVAQLRLVPHFKTNKLPCEAEAGDLCVINPLPEDERDPDPEGSAQLWFCVKGAWKPEGEPALWKRVLFEGHITCDQTPKPPPQTDPLGQG